MSSTNRKARGDRDYVTRKAGRKWAVRFQYPEALRESAMDLYGVDRWPPEKQISLDTHNELEARRRAMPHITAHLDLLAYHHARNSDEHMADLAYEYEMAPDTKERKADGTLIVASAATITTINPDNRIESRPNAKRPVLRYSQNGLMHPAIKDAVAARKKLEGIRYQDPDQDIIEHYLDRRFGVRDKNGKRPKPDKGDVALVRYVLTQWKERSEGKLLKDASRNEVAAFIKEEINRRSEEERPLHGLERTKKMVKLLIAAINENRRDAENTKFEGNPWADPDWTHYTADYVPARKAVPFTEEEIRHIKANKEMFGREEFMMIAMHCAMSVRPVGLCSIMRDEWVEEDEYDADARLVASHRVRCIFIEKDKDPHYGRRRLPIPDCLLKAEWLDGTPLLPDRISSKLFTTDEAKLNLAINKKLKALGFNSAEGKRLYSGRHRARQRLNSCRDNDVRRYIMGHAHERRDAHDEYGGYRAYEV